jgi:glycosyltransferase involved in cell wall biosynthesis
MRIALLGTRGVPARYGGFETCAEEIGRRLAARGHDITVYARSGYYPARDPVWAGMRVLYKPAVNLKALETLTHTAFSLADAVRRRFDALLVFNAANAPLLFLARMRGTPVVLHADGLEWMRGKWGRLGRAYFRGAEKIAVRHRGPIIADSDEIAKYYRERHGRETVRIAYGADIRTSLRPELLAPFGIEPGRYALQITRFEPENNPDLTVRAFEGLKGDLKLVLVGGAPYRSKTGRTIREARDARLVRPGFIYDKDVLGELLCNAAVYIHGNEAGGTNPSLLEAMAAGCFVIARDVPFNREALGEAGIYFRKNAADLREKLAWALGHPEELAAGKAKAVGIIRARYDWERVVDAYEALFRGLVSGGRAASS